jgi:hypothetical protein
VKTPNSYAQLANQARQLAKDTRPEPTDPCANLLNEAVVYLNTAARKLQEVAEFQAGKEAANGRS